MADIIAAHDISGVGRCSLATALAVLPALSHTCYPLPTAVLSQQTGLAGFSFLDFTPHMAGYLKAWRELKLKPDMIYTGFLGGIKQFDPLTALIEQYPSAVAVIDPVMGDNGKVYGCYGGDFVSGMRRFAKNAHILIPNATEFNLLCERDPASVFPDSSEEIIGLSLRIDAPKLEYIIITSAPALSDASRRVNLIIDIKRKTTAEIPYRNSGVSYNGAGDLFASVFCGLFLNKTGINEAVRSTGGFVSEVVDSMPPDSDPRFGVRYEPMLNRLLALNRKDNG